MATLAPEGLEQSMSLHPQRVLKKLELLFSPRQRRLLLDHAVALKLPHDLRVPREGLSVAIHVEELLERLPWPLAAGLRALGRVPHGLEYHDPAGLGHAERRADLVHVGRGEAAGAEPLLDRDECRLRDALAAVDLAESGLLHLVLDGPEYGDPLLFERLLLPLAETERARLEEFSQAIRLLVYGGGIEIPDNDHRCEPDLVARDGCRDRREGLGRSAVPKHHNGTQAPHITPMRRQACSLKHALDLLRLHRAIRSEEPEGT